VLLRGVLCGAILLAAAAGCASTAGTEPATALPAWTEPADYKFTFESSCGEQALIGLFRVTVADGTVTRTEGLDEPGRRALMLRIANLIPTLQQMVDQAEKARADGAEEVVVDRDSTDGHPVAIRIDESKNAVDDETCYAISEYTSG
jgi:hypothetical protein